MEGQLNLTQQNVTGRIIKSLGGFYYVAAEQEDRVIECRARGVFRQQNIKPCVGDWVVTPLLPMDWGTKALKLFQDLTMLSMPPSVANSIVMIDSGP